MPTLISVQNHNFTASSWGTADSTSLLVSSANNTTLTTSYVSSSTFTPGAITIDGIAVWVNTRLGSTGTISVALDQATVTVTGTEVTINVTDIPSDGNCWVLFKFAAPVLLVAATAYSVKAKTSSSTQVNLFRNATSNNWSRLLRTTTTAAPGAGDNLYILAEKTGAGTQNTSTVTMNNTASTIFGQVDVQSSGTLSYGTSASTAYLLKIAGTMNVRSGGELDIGTSSSRIPSTSSAQLLFSNSTNVDFGLLVTGNGIWKTGGNNNAVPWALLAADASVAATSLTTDQSTGWKNGDTIAIASTTQTASQCESKALTADASGTTLTITAITNAHSGTSPSRAELANLTRNVKVLGTSSSLQAYINVAANTVCDLNDTEFTFLGSGTAGKRGIDVGTTTGSFSAKYCSFHDHTVANSVTIFLNSNSVSNVTIQHCVAYNNNLGIVAQPSSGTSIVVDDVVFIRMVTTGGAAAVQLAYQGTSTSIRVAGSSGGLGGILVGAGAFGGTIDGLVSHSNAQMGIIFTDPTSGTSATISNISSWRNLFTGIHFGQDNTSTLVGITFDTVTCFGNGDQGLYFIGDILRRLTILSPSINGDATFATDYGLLINSPLSTGITIVNGSFGNSTAHTGADVRFGTAATQFEALLDNVTLASSTEVSQQSNMTSTSYLRANFLDQTQNHKSWLQAGTYSYDTTFADGGSGSSLRLTPLSASTKLQSSAFYKSVPSGEAATVTIKVRKSVIGDGAAYNGNQPRLIVRRNYGAGITSDTVLATSTVAGDGAFETLGGTTSAVGDDCALAFFVDCDGTTGWVNVDTFTVSTA